jgi:hypothetical protein
VLCAGLSWAADPQILDYARACAQRIGSVPSFNCLDGEIAPIFVDGRPIATAADYQPDMSCDNPALLPYDLPHEAYPSDGQCTPFSRALLLSDGNVQISAFCRRRKIRAPEDPHFDEIDVILHSVSNGSTCWFQAKAETGAGLDASRVPPPDEDRPRADGMLAAVEFWRSPQEVADEKCGVCHDSDPFMYSPFVAPVWHKVPADPFGWYTNDIGDPAGAPFLAWPRPKALEIAGNTCTTCHRVGSLFSCGEGTLQSVGRVDLPGADGAARSYPNSHWMPPGGALSYDAWEVIYTKAVDQLQACCPGETASSASAAPEYCEYREIAGKPAKSPTRNSC